MGSLSWLREELGVLGFLGRTFLAGEAEPAFQDGRKDSRTTAVEMEQNRAPRTRKLVDSASLAIHIGFRGLK